MAKAVKPKKKCCVSKTKCKRCPLALMKQGKLPSGYTVKKRKLIKIESGKKKVDKIAA
ncbi:MAG: hypothetical protein HZY75_12170 [Nocardioidaceae bacterium]|nr:MAG: hypothetical protein HZY75_12170 [Nocardioidaceae bacterium]